MAANDTTDGTTKVACDDGVVCHVGAATASSAVPVSCLLHVQWLVLYLAWCVLCVCVCVVVNMTDLYFGVGLVVVVVVVVV